MIFCDNPSRELVLAFNGCLWLLKVVQKPLNEIVQRHWRKSTNESKEKTEQKSDVAFEQFLELVSVFKKASRNFIFILVLQGRLKMCAYKN